jgi:hypothetical protein
MTIKMIHVAEGIVVEGAEGVVAEGIEVHGAGAKSAWVTTPGSMTHAVAASASMPATAAVATGLCHARRQQECD